MAIRLKFVPLTLCLFASVFWLTPRVSHAAQFPSQHSSTSSQASTSSSIALNQEEDHAQAELQKGTALTRQGQFKDAIPLLLAARGHVANDYVVSFNLALCYVGTREFKKAIEILSDLRNSGRDGADVENLLTQAYIGNLETKEAWAALQRAAALTPQNEKLYLFVADACTDNADFALGLKIVEAGLKNIPRSARLHYERAMFLSQLDEFDRAQEDFKAASQLGRGSEIEYLASAQQALFTGNIPEAVKSARAGIRDGFDDPILLTILGEALLRSGINPGQPEFFEAQTALEKSVALRPNDASSQIGLGQIDLIAGDLPAAIAHLEKARQMRPNQAVVYANLAKAYRRHGDVESADETLATLEKLNQAQAEKISSAPGDRKAGYAGTPGHDPQTASAPQ